jgi:hypothetical protein
MRVLDHYLHVPHYPEFMNNPNISRFDSVFALLSASHFRQELVVVLRLVSVDVMGVNIDRILKHEHSGGQVSKNGCPLQLNLKTAPSTACGKEKKPRMPCQFKKLRI